MHQPVDMPEFMQSLLLKPVDEGRRVRGQAIALVFKTMVGHHCNVAVEFGFPKNKRENGNEEVVGDDGKQFPVGRTSACALLSGKRPVLFEMEQNLRRVVLAACIIIEPFKFQRTLTDVNRHMKRLPETRDEFLYQPAVCVAKRKKMDELH